MHSQVIEYASDLREFWKRGYGHDINSKASCALFHDVFNRLNRAAIENRQVNVSHSLMLNATMQMNVMTLRINGKISNISLYSSLYRVRPSVCLF